MGDFFHFCNMYKSVFLVSAIVVLSACGQKKDEKFCECLSISEELNTLSQQMLEGDLNESAKREELKSLQAKKNKACDAYKEISAEESSQLRAACED